MTDDTFVYLAFIITAICLFLIFLCWIFEKNFAKINAILFLSYSGFFYYPYFFVELGHYEVLPLWYLTFFLIIHILVLSIYLIIKIINLRKSAKSARKN
jgi:hypothetical protein